MNVFSLAFRDALCSMIGLLLPWYLQKALRQYLDLSGFSADVYFKLGIDFDFFSLIKKRN